MQRVWLQAPLRDKQYENVKEREILMDYQIIDAPDYLEQLIIYEIATKSFTSPNGPESGTFASLEEKLPYLEELGINAVWLTGHQLCHESHFYNIWTEYACIRPDRIDTSLGTEEEFKHFVDSAHSHGIKVFLDVITHGVMEDSPIVKEHPDWFAGGSWGMKDYDWYGGHADLDKWWVDTWLWYIEEFGIDGYRLDVAHYRNDLWALIRRKASDMGKKIVIIAETGPAICGVTDILQHGEAISHNHGLNRSFRMLHDVAGYCRDRVMRVNERYEVKIFYEDGTIQDSRDSSWFGKAKVPEIIFEGNITKEILCADGGASYRMQMGRLRIENIHEEKKIQNIQVINKAGQVWNSNLAGVLEIDYTVEYVKRKNGLVAEFPLRIQDGQFLSVQLSCHDDGWVGFPEEESPYAAKGSRYLAGYTSLLAPGIPIFMSGEEFNADYRPLPQLAPGLYGEGEPGKGRWLYGSWIDWEQIKNQEKTEMLEDVKRIIQIRKTYPHLIHPGKMGENTSNFCPVDYEADAILPIPYCYRDGDEILLIAANADTEKDIEIKLDLSSLLHTEKRYEAEVLFGETSEEEKKAVWKGENLLEHKWLIKRDKTSQGGLMVLRIKEI